MSRRSRRITRGVLIGLAGGLVASWTMNQAHALWGKAVEAAKNANGSQDAPQPAQPEQSQDSEDSTVKLANNLSRGLLRRELSKEEKQKAGPVVHYAFGGAVGAVYGAAAELFPVVTSGFGAGFGAVLFTLADEIAVPAFGLSKKPQEIPASSHLSGLAAHLLYGVTTEGVRRAVLAKI